MITLIEAKNFRCLQYIKQKLGPFHVLVGPNASGKTTFLDVVTFLGKLVGESLEAAIFERSQNFSDLVWGRNEDSFELAIEAAITDDKKNLLSDKGFDTIRYEVSIGTSSQTGETIIKSEKVLLKKSNLHSNLARPKMLFPEVIQPPRSILTAKGTRNTRAVVNKVPGGNDSFYSEIHPQGGKGWTPSFKLGPRKSAFGNLLDDEARFPVSTWFKSFLINGVQQIILNSLLIRKASPPGQIRYFKSDGSNIPWVIEDLKSNHSSHFKKWLNHLQTSLPDLESISTIERPEDKHRYLVLNYQGGFQIPSWMASDGTLRLLALTLPAYIPDINGIFLIEEPENGIHPKAVETMFQSLSSVYNAQVLLATHSSVILSMVGVENVLCFAKTMGGSTDIVSGDKHPALKNWRGETDLGSLFASGILG